MENKKVDKYFDKTAADYSGSYEKTDDLRSFIFSERKRIVFEMFASRKGRILDVGCGPAVYTDRLSGPGLEVYGVDPSEKMIEIAASKNFHNAGFSVGRAEELRFEDNFFDGVLCIGVLEYLPDIEAGIKEIARVTKNGGTAIFTAPNAVSVLNMLDIALRGVGLAKSFIDREYKTNFLNPHKLDIALIKNGFEVTNRRFHIFRASFLNKISPRAGLYAAKKMNFVSSRFLGINYIVKCIKR